MLTPAVSKLFTKTIPVHACCSRYSTQQSQHQLQSPKHSGKIHLDPPQNIKRDWIGPADPKSNLRPIKFYIAADETSLEREFREKREEAQKWNMEFWAKHNENFKKEKQKYTQAQAKRMRLPEDNSLTSEDMYPFYKQFLNDNYKLHIYYNKEWYRRNLSLLWPALKVAIHNKLHGRR